MGRDVTGKGKCVDAGQEVQLTVGLVNYVSHYFLGR